MGSDEAFPRDWPTPNPDVNARRREALARMEAHHVAVVLSAIFGQFAVAAALTRAWKVGWNAQGHPTDTRPMARWRVWKPGCGRSAP